MAAFAVCPGVGGAPLAADEGGSGRARRPAHGSILSPMRTKGALALVALLGAPLFAGCTTDAANGGDCSARIRYQGIVYRSHQALNQSAPAGRSLGQGDVVDCGDVDSAARVDEVAVLSVRGVASAVAVVVKEKDWRGVYVSEEVPSSDWPQVLQGDGTQP